jgi:class 3 adenylate cyclase
VGIHSGPVIAGVIGINKFAYDLWGDAVNVASRMESHGEPGRVHVSEATHALLSNDFKCEARGEIEIKGCGKMRTWFVCGRQ